MIEENSEMCIVDSLSEDNIKLKLIVDLQKMVAIYWDELNVDGISILSMVHQLSAYMLIDLIEKVNEKYAEKIKNGVGEKLNVEDFTKYFSETVKEDVKIGE